jgi:cell division protein FtsB
MSVLREIRRRAKQVAPQVVAACVLAYFGYHAVQGERGFLAYLHISKELKEAQAIAAEVAEERSLMENRVALMRPDGLDPDMLEEQARMQLNFGDPGDVIIFLPDDERRE